MVMSTDEFLGECGLSGPLRVVVETPGAPAGGADWELLQPFAVIGRDAPADLPLGQADVSRCHAYLQVIAGRVFCVDLHSRTGICWKEGPRPWGWIDPGEAVRIGPARLRPAGSAVGLPARRAEVDALPISRAFGLPSSDEALLRCIDGGIRPSAWRISRSLLLVGRSPLCKVQLPGRGCADVHASLVRTRGGLWVVDLLGPGGTRVNGEPVRSARLGDGDELQLGAHRFIVHWGASASRLVTALTASGPRSEAVFAVPPVSGAAPEGPHEVQEAVAEAMSRSDADAGREVQPTIEPDPSLVVTLLREMSRQQAENTEQFQKVVVMLYQMHQDQMAVVNTELERLRRLVDERTALPGPGGAGHVSRTPAALERAHRASSLSISSERPPAPPRSDPPLGSAAAEPAADDDPQGDAHLLIARRLTTVQRERRGHLGRLIGRFARGGRPPRKR